MLLVQPDQELQFLVSNQQAKQSISLTNTHSEAQIAFRVRTTAPRLYSVRPSNGRLEPGQSCTINLILQAKEALDYKRKDKFQIQSVKLPQACLKLEGDALAARIAEIWSQAEQISKSVAVGAPDIVDNHKLRCVLIPPDGAESTEPSNTMDTDGKEVKLDRHSTESHHSIQATSPAEPMRGSLTDKPQQEQTQQAPSAREVRIERTERPERIDKLPVEQREDQPNADTIFSTDAPLPDSLDPIAALGMAKIKIRNLQAACDGYKAELDRLSQLRQRRQDTKTLQKERVTGISIPLVAAVAFLAFLIGWFF